MMKIYSLIGAFFCSAILMDPAAAQTDNGQSENEQPMSQEEAQEAERAADTMIGRLYVRELPTHWTPSEVISRLQELGYTDIREFDVEWGHYEVEATTPGGDEVEIEVDPVTGAILDVEENWF